MNKLTEEKAHEITGALNRLAELSQSKLVLPGTEEEKAKLERYLQNEARQHLGELLGTWFVVRREYEPLINVLTTVSQRIGFVAQQRAEAMERDAK
jgi:hypothetical protein